MNGLTSTLAERAATITYEQLPSDVRELAKQCLLDCLGAAIAGAREPLCSLLIEDAAEHAPGGATSIVGRSERCSLYQGALINGAIAHALDFDDVNMAMIGHPSAAILPGLLALAEVKKAGGRDFIAAFVAGYETVCSIGIAMARSHYERGFHCTATLGSFGAAAACGHLLKLDRNTMASALGIAGTQAAGLKIMFGTMCKPLHAGKASQNGVMAASLAARGFTSRPDVLEVECGFAATHSDGLVLDEPVAHHQNFYILDNLFKYHAACYNTHAVIEATRQLTREMPFALDEINRVVVRADHRLDTVCNIANPASGLEAKFSLRFAATLALAGVDTARVDTFTDANARNPVLVQLRDKVSVTLQSFPTTNIAEVEIHGPGGAKVNCRFDAGLPMRDLRDQKNRLVNKFHSLVDPVLGEEAGKHLAHLIDSLESLPSMDELARAACAN